jgi:hypothetical protein
MNPFPIREKHNDGWPVVVIILILLALSIIL